MPPVSVTMQPRNLPADEAWAPDVDDGALDEDDGALGEGELAVVADAHAVANRAMTPSATAFLIVVRNPLNLLEGRPAGGLRYMNVNSRVTVRGSRKQPRLPRLLPNRDTAGSQIRNCGKRPKARAARQRGCPARGLPSWPGGLHQRPAGACGRWR